MSHATARRRIGLTLGKYAPLHQGHQLVIETALSEMDHVIVIIYNCPETTPIALPIRASWIRRLYPSVELVEAWDGPLEVGDTPAIRQLHERYVIDTLGISGVTHFYSSEFYGAHMSQALGAIDRRVDEERLQVPISGTAIRLNLGANRQFLHPAVYADLLAHA
jgi:cytidyltransferase-like protein